MPPGQLLQPLTSMQVRRWALAAGYNLLQSNTTLHRGKNDFSPSRECEEHNSPRLSDESSASVPVIVSRPQRPCMRVCKCHKVSRATAQHGTLAHPALTRIQRSTALGVQAHEVLIRSISCKQCFEKVLIRMNTSGEGAVNTLLIRSFLVRTVVVRERHVKREALGHKKSDWAVRVAVGLDHLR